MSLTASEICKIIKSGKECGVSTVVVRDTYVRIEFGVAAQAPEPTPTAQPSKVEIEEQLPLSDIQYSRDSKELEEEDELAELAIEDPVEYERRLAAGELEDGKEEND
jgi:hypothetical protein